MDGIAQPLDAARCRDCGYPLRGLASPRCPECGAGFDPTDPRTMRTPAGAPAWLKRVARPMTTRAHRLAGLMLIACGVAVLWGEAALPGGRIVTIVSLPLLFALFVVHLIKRGMANWVDRRYAIVSPQRSLAVQTGFALFLAIVGCSGLPRRAVFECQFGPMHRTLVDLYAVRPMSETNLMEEWHGPWRLRRPVHRWYPVGFHVALGEGFAAAISDTPDGAIEVKVFSTWGGR